MEEKSLWARIKDAFNPPETSEAPATGSSKPNPWGLSGRQTQMQIRTMMQLKSFERKK